jgi:predicted GNAT superfamily acetyltransferase
MAGPEIVALMPGEATDDRLLALNNDHAAELSLLDPASFAHLIGEAFLAARVGDADALLLAFDEQADYASPNYRWFRQRLARFVYVDRIVVAPAARGRGLARRLYEQLFAQAAGVGHDQVVCEVNLDPPNPASDAFHARLGFVEAGRATLEGGKVVRYYARAL